MIKTMLEEDLMLGRSVYAMRFRRPASRFADDIQDPALQSTIAERTWTYVVLQEQSQIPAFWDTRFQYDFDLSVNATKTLNELIAKAGSETILMLTWGRRTSDWAWYPDMFPDFLTMQTKVTAGYETFQRATSTEERPVRIAPAGLAFEHIFKSLPGNASADGTDFSRLYEEDGTHPSIEGNYNQQNEWNRKFWELHPPASKNTPDNSPSHNEVPNPDPSKPYVPEDNATDTAPSSQGRGFWMMVVLVGAVAAVVYVRRKKGLTFPRNHPRAEYSDIAGLHNDFELVDVPADSHNM
eukprot:scaffold1071_cov166-Amphora_coffeaeformis.AAC.12